MADIHRVSIRNISPAFLKEGVGERMMYVFGLAIDAAMERLLQGVGARFPVITNKLSREVTPGQPDALAVIGSDRLIERGLSESDLSFGTRLQRAFEAWQLAGGARAELAQVRGYLLALTPRVRLVSSRYAADPARVAWRLQQGLSGGAASYPNARLSTRWDTYDPDRDPRAEPEHLQVAAGGGNWDWDSASQVTGSWGWWGTFAVFYATGANMWTAPAPKWGAGVKWGAGSAWGVTTSADVGRSMQLIIGRWKGAHSWVRCIIVSFDDNLFSPAAPAGGGVNPDGTFGRWSKIVDGECVRARFTGARYGAGVV